MPVWIAQHSYLTEYTFITLSVILCIFLPIIAIVASIALLREHHGRHVYTLWYLFFLITYCGVGIFIYLDSIGLIGLK